MHCSTKYTKAVPPNPVGLLTLHKLWLLVTSRYALEQLHFHVHKPNLAAATWYRISHNTSLLQSFDSTVQVTV